MAKAAAVFLIVHNFGWSHGVTSSPSCSEEPLLECSASSRVASLLQVDRTHMKVVEEGRIGKDSKPVSMRELLRHVEPLQSQLDDVKDRVSSLEKTVEQGTGHSGTGDNRKPSRPEPTSRRRPRESHSSDGSNEHKNSHESEGHRGDNDDKKDGSSSGDWAWDHENSDKDSSSSSDEDRHRSSEGHSHASRDKHMLAKDSPDWGGVAPRAWNGLEKVKAEDKGPKASWKGNGVGVSSGRKYSGDDPYEIMMDVDYVIDSNPEPKDEKKPTVAPKPTRKPGKSHHKPGGKKTPKKPGKSRRPSNGGKARPIEPKKVAKTSPAQGGKSKAKVSSKPGSKRGKSGASGKDSGPAGKSRQARNGGKGKSAEAGGRGKAAEGKSQKSPEGGGKNGPVNP